MWSLPSQRKSKMSFISSWSGGKESALACYRAIKKGFEVSHLLNMTDEKSERSRSHGLSDEVLSAQSDAIGIPIVQRAVTWDTYEQGFKDAIKALKDEGVEGVVFGDIDVQEHRDWTERICKETGVSCIQPLWKEDRKGIMEDFLSAGFEAIIVRAREDFFDKKWLGHRIDQHSITNFEELGVDVCGELGEYHTLVVDGPIFKKRIEVSDSKTITKDGFWSLDIKDFTLKSKS